MASKSSLGKLNLTWQKPIIWSLSELQSVLTDIAEEDKQVATSRKQRSPVYNNKNSLANVNLLTVVIPGLLTSVMLAVTT